MDKDRSRSDGTRRLEGRTAIVTGAGRGLGREHAMFLASQGANVVVNDLGGDVSGGGSSTSPAQQVVEEITNAGGKAIVSGHDVSDWGQAEDMIRLAVDSFGDLDVLVNNAGILRDRTLARMSEDEWDAVLRVHLKGHAAPTRHAVSYWRQRNKDGHDVNASVIHTSSISGYSGNFGQANYSSAKLAVVALSRVLSLEARKYGVRSNVVSPGARTRISQSTPDSADYFSPPEDPDVFDEWNPANVSPLVGWLAEPDCEADSQIFHIQGNKLFVMEMMPIAHSLQTDARWTLEELDRQLSGKLVAPPEHDRFSNRKAN